MSDVKLHVIIDSCQNCFDYGKCKAWKSLTKAQRVHLTIGNSTPDKFILEKCPLDNTEYISFEAHEAELKKQREAYEETVVELMGGNEAEHRSDTNLLKLIHKDLLLRADLHDGIRTVDLSHSIWGKLKDRLKEKVKK